MTPGLGEEVPALHEEIVLPRRVEGPPAVVVNEVGLERDGPAAPRGRSKNASAAKALWSDWT
jgi:hypothetical protein